MDVGGVACDEHAAAAVGVDDAVADPEHRRPPKVARRGGLGGQSVDHRLDVVQLRLRAPSKPWATSPRRRRGQPSASARHEHRHPVRGHRLAWQRDAYEQVVGAAVGLVHDADAVARAASTSPPRHRRACTAPRTPRPRTSDPGPCGRCCALRRRRPGRPPAPSARLRRLPGWRSRRRHLARSPASRTPRSTCTPCMASSSRRIALGGVLRNRR